MPPIQQSRVMQAEQEINAQLAQARTDLQQLTRLQTAAQEDLFGTATDKAHQIDQKRTQLRESIRRIHRMVVALPDKADAATREVAERIKRAKATALNDIAAELNRQEIQDLQAKAHKGASLNVSKQMNDLHELCSLSRMRGRYALGNALTRVSLHL